MMRHNKKVCFIISTGHSGSTLLGLVLGSHPEGFYLGEGECITNINSETVPPRKKSCKICGTNCHFWREYRSSLSSDPYENVSRMSGNSLVIDTSKVDQWRKMQVDRLSDLPVELYFIWLKRDGRAIVNSLRRRFPQLSWETIIDRWIAEYKESKFFYDSQSYRKISIDYGEFVFHPTAVVRELCIFLQLPFSRDMMNFFHKDHHPLGGNNGTHLIVTKKKHRDYQHLLDHIPIGSQAYYMKHASCIVPDDRWRNELPLDISDLVKRKSREKDMEIQWD